MVLVVGSACGVCFVADGCFFVFVLCFFGFGFFGLFFFVFIFGMFCLCIGSFLAFLILGLCFCGVGGLCWVVGWYYL